MGDSTIPLICYCDGNLINEDGDATYVGGYKKADVVSKTIGLIEFKEKTRCMMNLPSDGLLFKIKCGIRFDKDTLIAIDVDDEDSLKYTLDHSPFVRAYIIKQFPSGASIMSEREQGESPSNVDVHHGGNGHSKEIHIQSTNVSPLEVDKSLSPSSSDPTLHGSSHGSSNLEPYDFVVGQEFQDVDTFRYALSDLAVKTKRRYKAIKTTKSKLRVRCNGADCNWYIQAIRVPDLPTFKVTKYHKHHLCPVYQFKRDGDHCQATSKWIASKIMSDLEKNPHMAPSKIVTAICNRFGIQISYTKAVKAKAKALEVVSRPFEESYRFLPGLIEELKRSGCVTQLGCSKDSRFLHFFWAFDACIQAFRTHLRPVLVINTRPLRSGVLMTAYGVDGVNAEFYVAFGIFETENETCWEKFLNLLKELVVPEAHLHIILAIFTKFDSETVAVVARVFPGAHHCFSLLHFSKVFFEKFDSDYLVESMIEAALSYTTYDCDNLLEGIKKQSEDAYNWLMNVGKSHWSTSYSGKYGFGSFLWVDWMKNLETLPITELIVQIRDRVATNFTDSQSKGSQMMEKLTPESEFYLGRAIKDRERMMVEVYGDTNEYQVSSKYPSTGLESYGRPLVVNLTTRTCSCGVFQVRGIPCRHAAVVLLHNDLDIYSYCKHWLTADTYRATYESTFNPIRDCSQLLPQDNELCVLPPKRKVGRPPKKDARFDV